MHLDEARRTYTGESTELVCECLRVERAEIEEVVEREDISTVEQVTSTCSAGGGCGSCHEEIARLILSKKFSETLDFEQAYNCTTDKNLEIENLSYEILEKVINPKLSLLNVKAEIIEIAEEVVINLQGADGDLKYTLAFWIEAEFYRKFQDRISLLID
ncbi:MAG: (2Fe-2S)-binding protein [Blastocatellia bacterium]|nr:(2Fe-2S)-binding protein [Blastocatellia bacterium]